jgi:hypothetical protein
VGRQQTPSSEIWVSAIGQSVDLKFRNPAADRTASNDPPTAHAARLSRRRVVGCVGWFRVNFFAPPSRCPRRGKREKYFGFHSSVPTYPSPGHISYGPLERRVVNFGAGYRRENVTSVFSTAVVRGVRSDGRRVPTAVI